LAVYWITRKQSRHMSLGFRAKSSRCSSKMGINSKKSKHWQKAAEMAVAKFEKKAGQENTADRQQSVRPPLQKLKEITIWKQMKQLSKADRKKIIEELAIKFLEGEQLVAVIQKLDVDMMYISRKKSLQLPLNIVTYRGKQEDIALIDSGATNNFIDF